MSAKTIIAIDPGPKTSGVVRWQAGQLISADAEVDNDKLLSSLRHCRLDECRFVCEWIQAMGMAVGAEVFETCRFIGRIQEIIESRSMTLELITRPTVKTRICGTPRAKDPNVRQALIDMLGPVGTKKAPGPLFGVSKHAWSALAVAIAIDLK